MSKQRPSARGAQIPTSPATRRKTNRAPRLFRNTYTRGSEQRRVKNWSIKIQHQGIRRTLSLAARTRAAAAAEAMIISETILAHGWKAATSRTPRKTTASSPATKTNSRSVEADWRARLIRRPRPDPKETGESEFSVRIDHQGGGNYFPLGTLDEKPAAALAREIYASVVRDGWENVRQRYRRELTVALHWSDDPLAWTYTTLHSVPSKSARAKADQLSPIPNRIPVLVIDSDASVRRAVAECIDQHEGFVCAAQFESGRATLLALARLSIRLVLVGRSLVDMNAGTLDEKLRESRSEVTTLQFGVYEDSDHLFRATPGGASGYFLKRATPGALLEPMAGLAEPLEREKLGPAIRRYFQKLVSTLSADFAGKEMARLTAREHEILNLVSHAYVDKEIADALHISVWTVHGHLKKIFEKLKVHTRTEAAIKYLDK